MSSTLCNNPHKFEPPQAAEVPYNVVPHTLSKPTLIGLQYFPNNTLLPLFQNTSHTVPRSIRTQYLVVKIPSIKSL